MLQSRLMRVRCSAMGRFAQNESEMSESNESLGGRGCRTNRELALLRTTRDLTSSHFKHLNKPTVKLGLDVLKPSECAWIFSARLLHSLRAAQIVAFNDLLETFHNFAGRKYCSDDKDRRCKHCVICEVYACTCYPPHLRFSVRCRAA